MRLKEPPPIQELFPHPASLPHNRYSVTVGIHPLHERLKLNYRIDGPIEHLILPAAQNASRVDGLWRQLCCEAFIAPTHEPEYREFNLSPSGDWAHYHFQDYRAGQSRPDCKPPFIQSCQESGSFQLTAELPIYYAAPLRIGLSLVLEESGGRLSYWALHHPGSKPDFHHPDAFVLILE